ncbi:hypothetical protein [Fodinicurvata halophila]|uniref:hypothetical protein n=1 Tax=Fodinicurvata halophila TaxID=1419723 RepID=UPI00362EDD97
MKVLMTLMHSDIELAAYQGVSWADAPFFYASRKRLGELQQASTEEARVQVKQAIYEDFLQNLDVQSGTGDSSRLTVFGRFHSSADSMTQIRPDFLWDRDYELLVDENNATLLMPSGRICAEDLRVCPGAEWGFLDADVHPTKRHTFADLLRLWFDSEIWWQTEWQRSTSQDEIRWHIMEYFRYLLDEQNLLKLQGSIQFPGDGIPERSVSTLPNELLLAALEDWAMNSDSPDLSYSLERYMEKSWRSLRLLPVYLANPEDTERVGVFSIRFNNVGVLSGLNWWSVCRDYSSSEAQEKLDNIDDEFLKLSTEYKNARPLWDDTIDPIYPSWAQPNFNSTLRPEPEDMTALAFSSVISGGGAWIEKPGLKISVTDGWYLKTRGIISGFRWSKTFFLYWRVVISEHGGMTEDQMSLVPFLLSRSRRHAHQAMSQVHLMRIIGS